MKATLKHEHCLIALRRLLRSFARLMIGAAISYDEFATLVQSVYVESAIRDGDYRSAPSRKRVAIMTGLSTRQVDDQIDGQDADDSPSRTVIALMAQVLHAWHTNPDYVGPYGIPFELELSDPADRCIRSLVALADPKVEATVALDELMRAGVVARAGERRFRVVSRSLVPSEFRSHQFIEHYGERMSRLASTLEYNMDPRHVDKRFQGSAFIAHSLPVDDLGVFENHAREQAADVLTNLDNWLASQVIEPSEAGHRRDVGMGIFLYAEPVSDQETMAAHTDHRPKTQPP